jgi:hypothetical protein
MVGDTRQVDVGASSIDKFVQRSPDTYNFVDLRYVTNINLALDIVDKVTAKRCQTRRSTCVPNKYQRLGLGIKMVRN